MVQPAVDYDGRVFSSAAAETADSSGGAPVGHYHQRGDVVWAEFAGGKVVLGRLVGTCDPDGTLRMSYSQLLTGGEVVSGSCRTTPEPLPDGRLRLREEWERHGAAAARGVSYIEEVRGASPVPGCTSPVS